MKCNCFVTVIILCLGVLNINPVFAQDSTKADTSSITLKKALQANRYPIRLADGELKDEGGIWLRKQAKEATIVTLGEMHATQEIPRFMSALITDMQESGEVDYLALEVSPWTTERMADSLKAGKESYNTLIGEYPTAVPFYNFKNERDLVYQFVQNSDKEQPLWGLDQIFVFSTDLALDRLEELAPSAAAKAAIRDIRADGRSKSADDPRLQKLPAGVPSPITVYEPTAFDTLHSHFERVPEAQQIIEELQKSMKIYRLNDENNYRSNQIRARYLRGNLRENVEEVHRNSDENPQIVIKTGAFHAYRAMTPNNALDIGNLSISLARSMGGEALNVAILCGPKSQNRRFPDRTVDCWANRLGEDLRSLSSERPVLFDLTALHPLLHDGKISAEEELEDFLWGFDAVVLIPEATPAKPIASPEK